MIDREIRSTYQKITDLLSVNRLKEALDKIHPFVHEAGRGEWIREKEELDVTYKYMLKYTIDGIEDPERQNVYSKLLTSVYELADQCAEFLLTRDSVEHIHVQKRIFKDQWMQISGGEASRLVAQLHELRSTNPDLYQQKLSQLFNYLWLTDKYRVQEHEFVKEILVSSHLNEHEQMVLVSAINLSLWRFFDKGKFERLFDFYESDNNELQQRALIGLLIAFYKYDQRLKVYPGIRNRLLLKDEDPGFKKGVEEVIIQLIRSKDTEKLTKRMQEEILPEMMKFTPQLKKKLDLDRLLKESLGEDQNPEWEEILDDSPELKGKMEELTELQMEGSDVFMSSFSMLKHFPFFRHLPNWFFPFTADHPEIRKLSEDNTESWFVKFMEAIADSAFMCNSDKYSFCYGIQSMPDDMKQFLSDGLKAESEQISEILKDEELLNDHKKAGKVIRQYAQDLYRFYKLHPEHKAFEDIFTWRLDFHNKSFFKDLFIHDEKILYTIAAFYFGKQYYEEAAEVYQLIHSEYGGAAEVMQKIGFCYQKLGNFKDALKFYLKADILLPDNKWNLKKIGQCYRFIGQSDQALDYYRQAEQIDPDDLHTVVSIGHCLLDAKEFEAALKSYFKVEYLQPDNHKVWRPIAWCSLVMGKFDQARKYYSKLQERKPNPYDLMNLGHLEWCDGNRKMALNLYLDSIQRSELTFEQFVESFEEDQSYLIQLGVDAAEIPILLDHLRYSLEE